LKLVVDMNLSPVWVKVFQTAGHEAVHWSSVGPTTAPDETIMEWARQSGSVVFTHDLDYGALLYATRASSPSVIQLRCEDVRPASMQTVVLSALDTLQSDLANGALVTIDPGKSRIRTLPFRSS
jgi:predicted nuclease of predicted toxin-antitoxin system